MIDELLILDLVFFNSTSFRTPDLPHTTDIENARAISDIHKNDLLQRRYDGVTRRIK